MARSDLQLLNIDLQNQILELEQEDENTLLRTNERN
jgi:hypothetical protein